jgi:uncharacterized membrane protein (UPF0136 family)
MSEFLSKLTNFIGLILLISGIGLLAVKFVKPHLFKNQDLVLVVAFLVSSGLLFWFGGHYSISNKKEPQFILALLTLPAVFYTFETLMIRSKKL